MALGDYAGGELVVEGTPHDIRYAPLECAAGAGLKRVEYTSRLWTVWEDAIWGPKNV